ncbi:MAG TPA: GAF domain-containing protein [Methylomirabilota bacterium]|jgi:signal transduction histidine kinase|nr:GAF domain-containing protein [Methylomirabilota bacterium]
MHCPRCQHENRPQAKFCEKCARPVSEVSSPTRADADTKAEVESLRQALTEALEQQTATADILRVIASSPNDLQPVFDAIAERAMHLCGASSAGVSRFDGELVHSVALANVSPETAAAIRSMFPMPPSRRSAAARSILTAGIVHIPDVVEDAEYGIATQTQDAFRSVVSVPMLHKGKAIGAVAVGRPVPGPFPENQVALLKTFADQAVIAIENVRLFTELQQKNRALTEAHAQVTESLEQQTATGEILRVIASSPTDAQPVFDTIAESAVRLCDGFFSGVYQFDGHTIHFVAHNKWTDAGLEAMRQLYPRAATRETLIGRTILDRTVVEVHDLDNDPSIPLLARPPGRALGYRSLLQVPMLREGNPIGAISVARVEAGSFSAKQIALLRTFAAQAVIAIENVRLFKELEARNRDLTETLEQQTATAEILRVIASSPTDLGPVMETVAENAARVCAATNASIFRLEGEHLRVVARRGSLRRATAVGDTVPISRGGLVGQVVRDRRTIHVEDILAAEAEFPDSVSRVRQSGADSRTILGTPLLREGAPLGAIFITREVVQPFSAKQIELLETFANQAAIAIENVRLLTELRARTQDLTRSVEQLTALGEVGRAVSSTLDLETVLTTIVSHAVQLSGLDGGVVFEYDEGAEEFVQRAMTQTSDALAAARRTNRVRKGEGVLGRTAITLEPVQVADIAVPGAYEGRLKEILIDSGIRAILAVPMVRESQLIGCLGVTRNRPGEFPGETIDLLRTFATQSALAIQNARLFHEVEDKSRLLEAASRHKSEFLANMSHELRTPLNAILGFSEVLAERMFGEVNEKQAEYLQDILSSGRHLLSLINDILDLSKVEAGRLELELGRFHLPTALDNALTLVRERATRHGITLTQTLPTGVGDIVADERKVKQILLNLLSNAVKFTPEGGRVGLAATAAEGVVTISVSDTGIGIAPEDQGAIFEEFRQVGRDDARKQEGTGLGLTLAKKFVELHGGRIWIQSQVGQGSTFTFTLPVRSERMTSSVR